ncbi:SDR family oxidoreductase [Salinarimonas sp.]|uniref:SDR family oxidoreductase n=1 Tax=Salinarimonas sp. TaxID=2766526 RepID=UPI00391CC001
MSGVLVITGGSRGIGAATAEMAAKAGYAVAFNYAESVDAADALLARIRAAGGRAIAVRGDVTDEGAIEALFDEAQAAFGPVTALFNNAGITGPIGRLADLDLSDLRRVMEINVIGSVLAARAAVRRMSTARGGAGGAIVNMSSRASEIGGGGEFVHYGASKGAIDTLTVGLAREVGGEGIRVNAVAPGLIETEIHARAGAGDRVARLMPGVPMGRPGKPEEVASVVLWLMSDAASYVTGTVVKIGGGR